MHIRLKLVRLTKHQVLFNFISIFSFQICSGLTFLLLINALPGVIILIALDVKIYTIFMFSDKQNSDVE